MKGKPKPRSLNAIKGRPMKPKKKKPQKPPHITSVRG